MFLNEQFIVSVDTAEKVYVAVFEYRDKCNAQSTLIYKYPT